MEVPCHEVPEEIPSQSRELNRKRRIQSTLKTQAEKKVRDSSPLRRSVRLLNKSKQLDQQSSRKRARSPSHTTHEPNTKKHKNKAFNLSLDPSSDREQSDSSSSDKVKGQELNIDCKHSLKRKTVDSSSSNKSKPEAIKQHKSTTRQSARKEKTAKAFNKKLSSECSLPSFAEFAGLPMASREESKDIPSGNADSAGPSRAQDDLTTDHLAEEARRMQAMLEARGIPPHLLGSLGSMSSKMHHILHSKVLSSSNNSRAAQLLSGIESAQDEGLQLQACIEMGQLLVMGNEETISGFPVKQAVPALINLLSMEHNFDMMLNACRALTYMMEALPRSTAVVADAIPVLVDKLQVIQCMDVAEQALSALELLSKRHGKAVLGAGGLNACLLYLDFFSIAPQRNALSIAANCCQCASESDLPSVMSALPVLAGRLQHQDKASVESCCLCFSRLVENFITQPKVLLEIASQGLLPNIQQLLVISPPVISPGVFGIVVRMLSHLCASCPPLAVDLLKLGIAETLRYLLMGSGELTLDNIELISRSPNEVYEIISLAGYVVQCYLQLIELQPPLPKDGVFGVEELLVSRRVTPIMNQWEWQDNQQVWRPYGRMENSIIEAAHQAGEEECNIAIMGNVYIIDLSTMQQINEDTGTSRMIRRTDIESKTELRSEASSQEDARLIALREEPALGQSFVGALFGPLYEVLDSTAGPAVRIKCLKTILRIIYHTETGVLTDILKDISVSSHIATMLKAQDYRVVIGGIQMAVTLMDKLPAIFKLYFHREGVIYQLKALRDTPLKTLATPKPEVDTPPSQVVPPPETSQRTPTSARRRLSDIFRKGKRQLRRTLRGRAEEGEGPSSQTTPPNERKPPPVVTPEVPSSKDRIQEWIRNQSSLFLEAVSEESHPALDVVKGLADAVEKLDPKNPTCLTALTSLHSVLIDPNSSISAFEFVHYQTHIRLLSYLSSEAGTVALNIRLRHFLHTFMGLPDQGSSLEDWSPSQPTGVNTLLAKIHICVSQLEQLPVRLADLPGRRGSQALQFFNTHHIKCVLERHSSAVGGAQWKGGALRIDPLATIQTLERYMMVKGFGHHSGKKSEEQESEDGDLGESLLTVIGAGQGGESKHVVEFLIGGVVVPYHMTVFEAIRQCALGSSDEEDITPLGRPEIWIRTHTIHYRPVGSNDASGPSTAPSLTRSHSSSFPSPPHRLHSSHVSRRSTESGVSGMKRRGGANKSPLAMELPPMPLEPAPRLTRASAKAMNLPHPPQRSHSYPRLKSISQEEEKQQLPLHRALQKASELSRVLDDPCVPVLCLLKAIHAISQHWTDLYPGLAGSPIVPSSEFISSKLTAKTNRQLQDPLNVMTANFPPWVRSLATICPFLFPFECRQMLFYLIAFDRDRALARLQGQQPETSSGDPLQTATPRLEKRKVCVTRDNLLGQADKLLTDHASGKAVLEIHYQDEVGTGLGPTLEFYTLVSRELLRSDLGMWRGDLCPLPGVSQGASSVSQYVYSPVGVFPAPLGPSTKFTLVEEICSKFRTLGRLMARALLDSRMLDIALSEAFYKWMLGLEHTFTAQDLQHVDPMVARSFAQLAAVALKKHTLESDPLLSGKALAIGIGSLTLDGGGTVESLDLDFTLIGYPDIQLKPGGKDVAVTIHNLDEYLRLVVDWSLVRGVARQMEAFKEGFSSVFPISTMQGLFTPSEMDMLICGAHLQKWDIKELMETCRPDHGYSHDSKAVQMLFEVLSTYDTTEQRQFIQFVTGSPRLPVGGFRALNPPLTIVRKTVEGSQSPDNFLPSVMTCVNYLKLPDYSSVEVMREKLHFAFLEGRHSFHLS